MRVTKKMIMDLSPCYSEAQIDELSAGRAWVHHRTIAKLDISLADRTWVLTGLMTEGQQREFSRRCALDVIDKWDAPEVVVEYLNTGDESKMAAASYAASAAASDAAWAAASAAAWDAARAAARTAAWAAASDAAWSAASDAASAAASEKYLCWCVEYLDGVK